MHPTKKGKSNDKNGRMVQSKRHKRDAQLAARLRIEKIRRRRLFCQLLGKASDSTLVMGVVVGLVGLAERGAFSVSRRCC